MSAYMRTTLSNADYVRLRPNVDVARRRSFRPAFCHSANVRLWHLADIPSCSAHVRFRGCSGHSARTRPSCISVNPRIAVSNHHPPRSAPSLGCRRAVLRWLRPPDFVPGSPSGRKRCRSRAIAADGPAPLLHAQSRQDMHRQPHWQCRRGHQEDDRCCPCRRAWCAAQAPRTAANSGRKFR